LKEHIFLQKLNTFTKKLKQKEQKTREFIDKYMLGRYFKISVRYLSKHIWKLTKWSFFITINGALIYTAYLGFINPIHFTHTIFALGLCLWMPITLIKKAYKQMHMDRMERVRALPQAQSIKI